MNRVLFCILSLYCGCSSKNNEVNPIYKSRDELIKQFTAKTLMRSRGQNIILFYTHKNKYTNKYFFELVNDTCKFIRDSIEYTPDVMNFNRAAATYNQELSNAVTPLIEKMDKLNIRDIKADLADIGIDLEIYLKENKGELLYIATPDKVQLPYWKNFLNSFKRIDNNWYYSSNVSN